jgi:hypothetical protein
VVEQLVRLDAGGAAVLPPPVVRVVAAWEIMPDRRPKVPVADGAVTYSRGMAQTTSCRVHGHAVVPENMGPGFFDWQGWPSPPAPPDGRRPFSDVAGFR